MVSGGKQDAPEDQGFQAKTAVQVFQEIRDLEVPKGQLVPKE